MGDLFNLNKQTVLCLKVISQFIESFIQYHMILAFPGSDIIIIIKYLIVRLL